MYFYLFFLYFPFVFSLLLLSPDASPRPFSSQHSTEASRTHFSISSVHLVFQLGVFRRFRHFDLHGYRPVVRGLPDQGTTRIRIFTRDLRGWSIFTDEHDLRHRYRLPVILPSSLLRASRAVLGKTLPKPRS